MVDAPVFCDGAKQLGGEWKMLPFRDDRAALVARRASAPVGFVCKDVESL